MTRYVLLLPIGPIGSAGPIGAICTNELMPLGPIGSTGPIGAIYPIDANWANMFLRPNWRDMYFICQLGQLVPRAQLVRSVSMNNCQLGQLVSSAQLARYVLLMPIGPIGSTGPIGAICPIEMMPIGPIGFIGPIGAIFPIVANWANWFHGPNGCDVSHKIIANWVDWFHRPNWHDMYYLCQLGQLVPRAQLARYVICIPIGPIGFTGPIGAICLNELLPIGPIDSICPIARYFPLMPLGPIGSTGPIGAICPIVANWANWFRRPNWCDMYQ